MYNFSNSFLVEVVYVVEFNVNTEVIGFKDDYDHELDKCSAKQ